METYQKLREKKLIGRFAEYAGISRNTVRRIFLHSYDIGWRKKRALELQELAKEFLKDKI